MKPADPPPQPNAGRQATAARSVAIYLPQNNISTRAPLPPAASISRCRALLPPVHAEQHQRTATKRRVEHHEGASIRSAATGAREPRLFSQLPGVLWDRCVVEAVHDRGARKDGGRVRGVLRVQVSAPGDAGELLIPLPVALEHCDLPSWNEPAPTPGGERAFRLQHLYYDGTLKQRPGSSDGVALGRHAPRGEDRSLGRRVIGSRTKACIVRSLTALICWRRMPAAASARRTSRRPVLPSPTGCAFTPSPRSSMCTTGTLVG